MQKRFTTIYFIILFLLIYFVGLVTLRYLQGYELLGREHSDSTEIFAPSQVAYKQEPTIIKILQFLSHRWGSPVNKLYVLAIRPTSVNSGTELGVVDSSSLTSARIFIPSSNFPNMQKLFNDSIAYDNNIYLLNEYKPLSSQEMSIARQFYATAPKTKEGSRAFGIIVWWKVNSTGNGSIKAFTDGGSYPTYPVIGSIILKRFQYISN